MFATGLYTKEEVRKKLWFKGLKLSKTPFWSMMHNVVYCGKINVPANKTEEEQIVQGLHAPIISENLFYTVQAVAQGKK